MRIVAIFVAFVLFTAFQPTPPRVERLREALMRDPDCSVQRFGYDRELGLVRCGNWDGGPKSGAVLLNAGLIAGVALDYWNEQAGEPTHIEANVRKRLEEFDYDGEDKREVLLGRLPSCVRGSSGQQHYDATGVIVTALPTECMRKPTPDRLVAMPQLVPWIVFLYRQGHVDEAQALYDAASDEWLPEDGMGIDGSTGGVFSDALDRGRCKSARVLGYYLLAGRLTGFDKYDPEIAQEVENQLWALQNPDGSIRVAYALDRRCNRGRSTPESTGLSLLAMTPPEVLLNPR